MQRLNHAISSVGLSLLLSAWCAGATLQPFLEHHCSECHDATDKKGGLHLTSLSSLEKDPASYPQWIKVFDRILSGEIDRKSHV